MIIAAFQQAGDSPWPPASLPILLALLAISAIVLWRRYQSRRMLVERIKDLEALSVAGRAIVAAQLDIVALCRLIGDEAAGIINARSLQIGLFDEAAYEILYWTRNGRQQETPVSFDLDSKPGIISWIRDNKRALLVSDFKKELDQLPALPSYISDAPPRSAVFVPLVSGRRAIGVLAAQSHRPGAFSQQDLGRLEILSNQAAAAIANAQIYQRGRTRAAHLELVGQIARQVNAITDLDELLGKVVELTRQTFKFESVNIFGIEDGGQAAVIQASTIPGLTAGELRLQSGQGLVGTAVAKRETTLSNDTHADKRFHDDHHSASTRSEIAIPLIVNGQLLGALDVQSSAVGAFTMQERAVLEALADQAAIAIHKAQQFNQQRIRSWVATAQLQVAEAIGRVSDLESLAETLVRLTPMLSGCDSCAILLRDDESGGYRGAAEFGLPDESAFANLFIQEGQWRALDAVHVGLEPRAAAQAPPWIQDADANQRYMLLPLVAKGSSLGALLLGREVDGDHWPSEAQDELLRNIANQAALAVDSMMLHIAQQEEAWVNTALLQVAESVNKLTDLNEILNTIVRMVPMLVGVNSCVVLIRDEEQQAYRAGPSFGLSEMGQGLLESFDVDFAEFPLLGRQDVERIGPDAAYYTFRLPEWMDIIMDSETADVFPLYARASLVGAMVVGPALNGRPLSGRRLNIVTGIAQQAAIAVVNDRLYRESAERSRMEQELQVARSIQASFIPVEAPQIAGCDVSGYWQAAREVSGDFYDFLRLSDGRWGIAIADVADKGVPAALFMALSRTILRTVAFNRENPADVLQRSNKLIYNDSTSDLFVTVFYAVWDASKRTLSYASAGHNPPILIRHRGRQKTLNTDGIALGVIENASIEQRQVELYKGDVIIFYTDGVTEAINEDYDEFGLERLSMVARDNAQGVAAEIVAAITAAVHDHSGDTPQYDDITLVVLKV
ncbi:MAG: SpoIIE family protein phosphatase [Chloroflexota bacterium]|jgi:serine phosphatase RsbU (regulator of sigma subunit)/putative methionine-R-sulfoxide reductase with GAF domain